MTRSGRKQQRPTVSCIDFHAIDKVQVKKTKIKFSFKKFFKIKKALKNESPKREEFQKLSKFEKVTGSTRTPMLGKREELIQSGIIIWEEDGDMILTEEFYANAIICAAN